MSNDNQFTDDDYESFIYARTVEEQEELAKEDEDSDDQDPYAAAYNAGWNLPL